MKCIGTLYFLSVSLLLVACGDPAITIRQIKPPNEPSPQMGIDVRKESPFAGLSVYVPQVMVTNSSDSPVSVTSVELATKLGTYANKPVRLGSYPVDVQPGKTEPLDIWFDLTHDVKQTFFRQHAELLIHYSSRGRNETAHASIIGGPLDSTAR